MKKSVLFLVLPLMAILLGVSSCKKDDPSKKPIFSASFSETDTECVVKVTASDATIWQVSAVPGANLKAQGLDPYNDKQTICESIAKEAPRFFTGNNEIGFYKTYFRSNEKYYFYTFSVNNVDELKITEIAEIFEYSLTSND